MTELLVKEQLILAREREKREKESSSLEAGVLEAHQKTYWRLSEPSEKTFSIISSLSYSSSRGIKSGITTHEARSPTPPSLPLSSPSSSASWSSSFSSSVDKENRHPETAAAFSHVDSLSLSPPSTTAVSSLLSSSALPPSYSLQDNDNNSREGIKMSMCERTDSRFSIDDASSSLLSQRTPPSFSSSYHPFSYKTISAAPDEREEARHAVISSSCSSLLVEGRTSSLPLGREDEKTKDRSAEEIPLTARISERLGSTACMQSPEETRSLPLQGDEMEREKKEHYRTEISTNVKTSLSCLSSSDSLSYLSEAGSSLQHERNQPSFSASFLSLSEKTSRDSGDLQEGERHHGGSLVNSREKEQAGDGRALRWEGTYQGIIGEKTTEEERRRAREKEVMDEGGRGRESSPVLSRRQAVSRQRDSCTSEKEKGESSSEKEDHLSRDEEDEGILQKHPKDSTAVLEDLIISSILLKETGGEGGGRDSFGVHTPPLSQEGRCEERLANLSSDEKDLREKEEEEKKKRDTASCSHSSTPPLGSPSFPSSFSTSSSSSIFARAENEGRSFPEKEEDVDAAESRSSARNEEQEHDSTSSTEGKKEEKKKDFFFLSSSSSVHSTSTPGAHTVEQHQQKTLLPLFPSCEQETSTNFSVNFLPSTSMIGSRTYTCPFVSSSSSISPQADEDVVYCLASSQDGSDALPANNTLDFPSSPSSFSSSYLSSRKCDLKEASNSSSPGWRGEEDCRGVVREGEEEEGDRQESVSDGGGEENPIDRREVQGEGGTRRGEKDRDDSGTEGVLREAEDALIDQESNGCALPRRPPPSSSFSFSHQKDRLSIRKEDIASAFTTPSTRLLPATKDPRPPPFSSSFSDRETDDTRLRLSRHASVQGRSSKATGEEREKAGELEEEKKKKKDKEEREGFPEDENEEEKDSQACLRRHQTITPTTCSSSRHSEREEEEEELEEDNNRRSLDTPSFSSSSSCASSSYTPLSERMRSEASSSQQVHPPASSSLLLLWRELLPHHEFPRDEKLLLQLREKLRKVLLEFHCMHQQENEGEGGTVEESPPFKNLSTVI